jgi:aminoglycoside phosphotransferase (APT) family kinase protein
VVGPAGPDLTVRLPSGDWYAEQVDKEQRWLPVLAPQLPLPLPTTVARRKPDAAFPWSGSSRDRFRADVAVDAGTWSRGRGWALWKALISLVGHLERDAPQAALARRDIDEVLADYAREG